MAQAARAQTGGPIAFGHTHTPWHRVVDGIHFVNAGSVGRPKDGDWRACFAVIAIGAGGEVRVEFVRVEYDIERVVAAINESELPNEFADYLRSGGRIAAPR
jgi:predicted phosphodiesterase